MAYKVNYNFQKAERDRAKAAKKEAKLREKQAARTGGESGESDDAPATAHDDGSPATAHADTVQD